MGIVYSEEELKEFELSEGETPPKKEENICIDTEYKIATTLKVTGSLIIIIGILSGVIYSMNIENYAFVFIIGGCSFVSGIIIIGLGSIVTLLQRLVDKK